MTNGKPGEPGHAGESGERSIGQAGGAGGVGGAGGAGGEGEPVGPGGEGGGGGTGGRGGGVTGRFMSTPRTRLAAYVFFVIVVALVVGRVEQNASDGRDRLEREAQTRADEGCVSAWAVRQDIRNGITAATLAGGEAIIAVATDVDAAQLAAFREQLDTQAAVAAAEIPDPECDLEAAERRLNQ
jgi:hypothetical protein